MLIVVIVVCRTLTPLKAPPKPRRAASLNILTELSYKETARVVVNVNVTVPLPCNCASCAFPFWVSSADCKLRATLSGSCSLQPREFSLLKHVKVWFFIVYVNIL